jgi:hypothetical protein
MKPHARPNVQGGRSVEIASRQCSCGHLLEEHHDGECLHDDYNADAIVALCRCQEFRPREK